MEIEYDLLASRTRWEAAVVGIGTFDGVHRAHRILMDTVTQRGRALSMPSAILTFDPHPKQVLFHKPYPILTSIQDRLSLIGVSAIDFGLVIRFTREFSQLSPETFARDVLKERLGARAVIVGYNFTFGRGGKGTPDTLKELGQQLGFEVQVIGPVKVAEQVVSSSVIREALRGGAVEQARELLGRPYAVEGTVETGSGRGRTIGFPTANLKVEPAELILPQRGVYHGTAEVLGSQTYPALINIGCRPTFDGDTGKEIPEIYLHGFSGNLVGKRLRVIFRERIRDEQRFSSVDSLVAQIRRDLENMLSKLPQLDGGNRDFLPV
jgi:riboflavin kinase/FMN adenylyltransferase